MKTKNVKNPVILLISLQFLIVIKSYSMPEDSLLMLLPGENSSWPVKSEKIYTTDHELYDYINGGAELYLQYNVIKLAKRIYNLPGNNELKAEIFDMKQPKNAYGVFSYSRHKENIDMGQGAQYSGGSLIFWQDRYFVSLFTTRETEKSKEQLSRIGSQISEAIGSEGTLPSIFYAMPKKSLNPENSFYFHHPAWQNKFTYISNENIFNINENTLALLNKYGTSQNRYYLVMIEYPDRKKARKARKKSIPHLSKELKTNRLVQNKKGEWTGYELIDRLLIVVLRAPSKEKALYLLKQTIDNYNKDSE